MKQEQDMGRTGTGEAPLRVGRFGIAAAGVALVAILASTPLHADDSTPAAAADTAKTPETTATGGPP